MRYRRSALLERTDRLLLTVGGPDNNHIRDSGSSVPREGLVVSGVLCSQVAPIAA